MSTDAFGLALAAALRDEAQEIAMSTDVNEAGTTLQRAIDHVDRARRRTWWVTGMVAAAAVAAIALVIGMARPMSAPPAGPSPSSSSQPGMPYTSASLTPAISLTLPYWTSLATAGGYAPGSVSFAQADCAKLDGKDPCDADSDLRLRLESVAVYFPYPAPPTPEQDPTYDEFLAHLDSLATAGVMVVSDRAVIEVDGRDATVMTFSVNKDAPGVIGCPDAFSMTEDCFPLVAGRAARLALVDQGGDAPPTLIYLSMNGDAPDLAEQRAEFDRMLATVSFD